MEPIDALKGRLSAATPLLQTGQLRGYLSRFLL